MPLVAAGQNALLTGGLGNAVGFISLHSGDPSTTGTNELTGGSPAYARKAVTWNTVGSGQRTNNGAIVFDIPASTTVYHIGLWSLVTAGTFYGYFPIGGFAAQAAAVLASTDLFTCYAHGYTTDHRLLTYDIGGAGVPAGLTEGTVYFVLAAGLTTDAFELSTTSGGSAVNVTANGEVAVQRCLPEVFGAQGTLTIADATLSLDGRFV